MIRRALACGAAVGLVEAARGLAALARVTPVDGAWVIALATLAYAAAAGGAALVLAPLVARWSRAVGASGERAERLRLAFASGTAGATLVAALRLRALAGAARPELVSFASGPLLEGAAVGLALGVALSRLPSRWLRGLWATIAAAALASAVALGLRDDLADRFAGGGDVRPRPNLLLVSIDTLRADRLGAYGGPPGLTPVLDRLAAAGALFERATSPMPLTGPTHTTMLTGLEPARHGVRRNGVRLGTGIETVAARLAAAGYRTGGFVGGWPLTDAFSGLASHFRRYDDDLVQRFGVPHAVEQVPLVWLADRAGMLFAAGTPSAAGGPTFLGQVTERGGALTVERALAWMARRRDRPFFAFVHLYEPHAPYAPPSELLTALVPGATGELARFDPAAPERPLEDLFADPAAVARIRRLYDAEVAAADAHVGRLLAGLERLGRAADTVVVVTADHGEGLGEHGEYFRHSDYLYETTLHVPLLVRRPREPAPGRRIGELVSLADVAPTLLALAELRPPAGLDGRSLVPLLDGDAGGDERLLHASIGGTTIERGAFGAVDLRHAVRDRRFKLIWSLDRRWPHLAEPLREEIYDLEADAGELVDLSSTAIDPAPLARLRDEIRRRLARPAAHGGRLDPETERRLRALGYL
jgi:arylsulfatase A-like enzyme